MPEVARESLTAGELGDRLDALSAMVEELRVELEKAPREVCDWSPRA